MGELLRKLSTSYPAKAIFLDTIESTDAPDLSEFYGNNLRESRGSEKRTISKKNIIFLDEKESGVLNANNSSY